MADDAVGEPLSFVDHDSPDPSAGPSTADAGTVAATQADVPTDEQAVASLSPGGPGDAPYVRIERSVLTAVREDVVSGPGERGGLLLGWYDDASDTVSITGSWPMERGERPGPFTPPSWVWESAIDAADEAVAATGEGGGIVGWYRGSAGGGVWMTAEAVEVQNERFGDRALVAMVVDPPTGEAGFFAGTGIIPTRISDWEIWSIEASRHPTLPATQPVGGDDEPYVVDDDDEPAPAVAAVPSGTGTEAGRGFVWRHRAWFVAAVAAAAGLLAGLLVGTGDGGDDGPRAPSAAEVARDLSFEPSGAPVATGRTGTVISFETALRWVGERPPDVSLEWGEDDLGGTVTPAPSDDQPGRYVVQVTPDVKLAAGPYQGAVVARRCPGGAAACAPVERETVRQPFTIQVDSGSTTQVPQGLAVPDPARMAGDGALRSIPDELLVTLDVGSDTADATALELARGTGATVIGGDAAGRVYQLRYADTAARDGAVSRLDADQRVGTITLDRDLGAAPAEPTRATAAWHLDALGGGLPFPGRQPPAQLAIVGPGASLDVDALGDVGVAGAVSPPATVGLGTYAAGVACMPSADADGILAGCSLSAVDTGAAPPTSSIAALYAGVLASGNTQAPVVLLAFDPDGGSRCGAAEPAPGDPRVGGIVAVASRAMQVVDDQASGQGRSVLWVLPAGDGCFGGQDTVSAGLADAGFDNLAIVTSVDQSGALSSAADAGNHIAFAAPGGKDAAGNGIPGPVGARRKGDRTGTLPAAAMAAGLFAEARAGAAERSAVDIVDCVEGGVSAVPSPAPPVAEGRNVVGDDQLRDTHRLTSGAIRLCATP